MVKLVYFAWVRERIGKSDEEMELPGNVNTVGDLLSHLKTLGEGYESALAVPEAIHVAINQQHCQHTALIGNASEIALFPPMTGG